MAKFSPRDSLVASAGFDRTLRLWEGAYPYSQVACLEGHRQLISDLCWAPDGRSLLSASFDQVRLGGLLGCCSRVRGRAERRGQGVCCDVRGFCAGEDGAHGWMSFAPVLFGLLPLMAVSCGCFREHDQRRGCS